MTDLDTQLIAVAEAIESSQEPVRLEEIVQHHAIVPAVRRPTAARRLAVALTVLGALVVTLFVAWVDPSGPRLEPADDSLLPPPTASETTLATGISTPDRKSGPEVEPTELDKTVTSLGTVKWTRVTDDRGLLPAGQIEYGATDFDPYVVFDGLDVWSSPNGIDWRLGVWPAPDGFDIDPNAFFEATESWGVLHPSPSGDQPTGMVFRRSHTGTPYVPWIPLDLPEPSHPDVEGLDWRAQPALPVQSGTVTLIPGEVVGSLPLVDLFGAVSCGGDEPCDAALSMEWDETAGTVRIGARGTGLWPRVSEPIATLTVATDGNQILFTDEDSGEVVHRVTARDPETAESLVVELTRNWGVVRRSGAWTATGAGPFEWRWAPGSLSFDKVAALPGEGFVAYDLPNGAAGQTPLVWTSRDGRVWEDRGALEVDGDGATWIEIDHLDTWLQAMVVGDFDPASGEDRAQYWTSTDGIEWTLRDWPFPAWTRVEKTNFGFAATAMPQSRMQFWVSGDGQTWEAVEGPPGPHEPNGAGSVGAGAAGDILYLWVAEDSGTRTLWVGSLEK